jgi:hypothetical protein
MAALSEAISALVELVLADDTTLLDALPEPVEASLVTPLSMLASINDDGTDPVALVVGARLVRRSLNPYLRICPPDLVAAISRLPD